MHMRKVRGGPPFYVRVGPATRLVADPCSLQHKWKLDSMLYLSNMKLQPALAALDHKAMQITDDTNNSRSLQTLSGPNVQCTICVVCDL